MCLKKIISMLDQTAINDQILPALDKIRKSGGRDNEITMAILEIYEQVSKNLSIDVKKKKHIHKEKIKKYMNYKSIHIYIYIVKKPSRIYKIRLQGVSYCLV